MSLEPKGFQREIEEALKALAESRGDKLIRQIRPIILANLDRGRVQTFTEGKPDLIPAYVSSVVDRFLALNGLLHQLQSERSAEAWSPLFERMQTWAYNFLCRKGFAADHHTRETAIECATEAALNLLNAYFPYDTDFDPWAHIIVQNACRKFIDRAFKQSAIPEDHLVELEDNLAGAAELLGSEVLRADLGEELQNALAQLPEARRTVIELIFFDELTAEEAARKMGKTIGAIYSLQFHALHKLRKILSTIRDSLNE